MQELTNALFNLRPEGWLTLALLMLPLTLHFTVNLWSAARERSLDRIRLNLVREKITPALDVEDGPESDEMADVAFLAVKT